MMLAVRCMFITRKFKITWNHCKTKLSNKKFILFKIVKIYMERRFQVEAKGDALGAGARGLACIGLRAGFKL